MDSLHMYLKKCMRGGVVVPRSVPGLVTKCVIVMDYLPGVPRTQLASHTANIPARINAAASRRVLLSYRLCRVVSHEYIGRLEILGIFFFCAWLIGVSSQYFPKVQCSKE